MHEERPGLRGALVALQHRDFRLFYGALVVASLGQQIQATANLWQIYEMTDSPLHLGLLGLTRGVPIIALSLMGGIVADRTDRRRLIMLTQALMALISIALGVLTATGAIAVWHLYAATLLTAALNAVNAPARSALVPNLVPREHLLNALALNSTIWQTANIVGPALAGASIAGLGLAPSYALNGGAYVISLGALALMYVGPVAARAPQSALKSLLEGLAFVRYRSIILTLLAMDCAATFFGSYRVLMPVFARDLGVGAEGLGLLLAAPAAGGLLGAAIIMSLSDLRYKGLIVAGGILGYCAALVALALSPWFLLSLLVAGALGLFDSLQATPRSAVIQQITPDDLRGRVSSFQTMLTNGVPPLGQTQLGAVAAILGAPLALIAGAIACAVLILGIVVRSPDLRAPDLGSLPRSPRAPA